MEAPVLDAVMTPVSPVLLGAGPEESIAAAAQFDPAGSPPGSVARNAGE
jgi:hypothetical protein